jgi:hypothetical protein
VVGDDSSPLPPPRAASIRVVAWWLIALGLLLAGGSVAWFILDEGVRQYGIFVYVKPPFPWPEINLGAFMAGVGLLVLAIRRP